MASGVFKGFPPECIKFYAGLKKNNEKRWFDAHRQDFDDHVMDPARGFVAEMGRRLGKIAPRVQADPRVNRSLFRIHRDTRFSKDKTPYKTNLAIWLWEGPGARMECSGYYFHLEPPNLMLGVGIYMFPKDLLDEYRQAVVHDKYGKALRRAIARCEKLAGCKIGGKHYKRVPRGFDPEHSNTEYLMYNGLYAGVETKIPKLIHSPKIIDYCNSRFKDMAPLHKWLLGLTERAAR
ncbi:DUF2461 domain-containing protein [Candidatus Eisenbacteria bacterium]|uniref:DUF2461 domain-containing protein n=1 Tax=Eiseniibacteriota bacterium TaxID=2212470 RepID=A0ABV6YLW3_UNCEI